MFVNSGEAYAKEVAKQDFEYNHGQGIRHALSLAM